jgi:hypothetical protein
MVTAMPYRWPVCTGRDSSSVTNPSLTRPATRMTRPVRTARTPARATAVSGSSPPRGRITAAITAASDE